MTLLKFTKKNIIISVIASLLPLAVIALGTLLLLKGSVLTLSLFLAYYLAPLLIIACVFALAFLNVKALFKILIALLIPILIFSFFAINLFGYFEIFNSYEGNEVAERYDNRMKSFPMPELSEVGETVKTQYYEFFSQFAIFTVDTNTLICAYDEQEYLKQKEALSSKYKFHTQIITHPDDNYPQPYYVEPIANVDGYVFKVVDEGENADWDMRFPKHIMMIATNDETKEIVYMSFFDDDLDYIDYLDTFIIEDCGFRRIR